MFFYNVGVILYSLAVHIASLFNSKAKLWVNGRNNWRKKLIDGLPENENRIWVHCASLGEFEQGRSVIEKIKQQYPHYKIIISFFSPSGYKIRKDYEFADFVCYLPIDTPKNAIDFIKICQPKAVIFVKYEFWINYLFQLKKQKIPTFLISAVFKEYQPFFKWYGCIFRDALKSYETIFVQDNKSLELLESLKISTGVIRGDTRIDRVLKIKEINSDNLSISEFTSGKFTIIAGSTWPKDNEILVISFSKLKKSDPKLKFIIALHEVEESNVKSLIQLIERSGLKYDLITNQNINNDCDILIINTIGLLSSIYKYGKVAYIGGGFDDGIHNILEPAVQGLPVIFGPNYTKFIEACDLVAINSAYRIQNVQELTIRLSMLISDSNIYNLAAKGSLDYINKGRGASEKITEQILLSIK